MTYRSALNRSLAKGISNLRRTGPTNPGWWTVLATVSKGLRQARVT